MSFARGLGLALMAGMASIGATVSRGFNSISHVLADDPVFEQMKYRTGHRSAGNAPPRRRAWKRARRGGGKMHLAFKGSHAKR